MTKPDCGDCRREFAEFGRDPDCSKCWVDLLPANEQAVTLYAKVQSQVRVSAGGDLIGLDFRAMEWIFELYEVENQREALEAVVECFEIVKDLNK